MIHHCVNYYDLVIVQSQLDEVNKKIKRCLLYVSTDDYLQSLDIYNFFVSF